MKDHWDAFATPEVVKTMAGAKNLFPSLKLAKQVYSDQDSDSSDDESGNESDCEFDSFNIHNVYDNHLTMLSSLQVMLTSGKGVLIVII